MQGRATLYNRFFREEMDRRLALFKAWQRGHGPAPDVMFKGDLKYQLRDRALAEASRLGLPEEAAIGNMRSRSELDRLFKENLRHYTMREKVHAGQLGLKAKPKGSISRPDGSMEPWLVGATPHSKTILVVEKGDTAVPLAQRFASLGITVLDSEGGTSEEQQEDCARWMAEGRKVLYLSDEDRGGYVVAKALQEFGVRRITLSEIEQAAGAKVGRNYITEDFSYTHHRAPHKGITDEQRRFLIGLGERVGKPKPHRVELNGMKMAYGIDGFAAAVRQVVEDLAGPLEAMEPGVAEEVSLISGLLRRLQGLLGSGAKVARLRRLRVELERLLSGI